MPTLNWLTRDEDIGAASRVPYRLLEEASICPPASRTRQRSAGWITRARSHRSV